MAEKKTLEERYADEVLTDNTQFDKCRQCKDCIFRDDGTVYSKENVEKKDYELLIELSKTIFT